MNRKIYLKRMINQSNKLWITHKVYSC